MTIEAVGSIGELIAAIATVATLFYLALQIRHGAEVARADSQQALLDTFFDAAWNLARDTEMARIVGAGLVSFDALDDREKTVFTLILGRFVGNLEKGLRLLETGLIDQATVDQVAIGLVSSLKAPGGAEWWQTYRRTAAPLVAEYLERRVADPLDADIPFEEQFPYWARWGSDASSGSNEPAA